MDINDLTPDGPLPDDVASLQALLRLVLTELVRLREENARLRQENAQLKAQLEAANKHRFGRRKETLAREPGQKSGKPGKARPHGRKPDDLPRREVVHDLDDAQKLCPCCGVARLCIGQQATEQLEIEPAKYFVLRTIKKTYACRHCEPDRVPAEQRITTAGPPEVGPLARSLCGPTLLAHVVTAKFADHCPLHRLSLQLARSGVTIPDSTLGGWVAGAAVLLTPLVELMRARLLRSRAIFGDDTTVKLRQPGQSKTARSHLWGYLGDADYPYVVFDFTADYTAEGPREFLKGYKGYLHADGLAQYECLYRGGDVLHVCCWAHARRKFVSAAEGGEVRAKEALERIGRLYAVESSLPVLLGPSSDPEARRAREAERQSIRASKSKPILEEFWEWLGKQSALPKSSLGQAQGYALNHRESLDRYVERGYLSADNNLSERTLRAIALGRNNWGVFGSESGGRRAATLYSVVCSCKQVGVDPFGYLRVALPGLFSLGEKPIESVLSEWLPDRLVRPPSAV
jgi:transposase